MDLENNSQEEYLLNTYSSSTTYDLLLKALQRRDFHYFRNMLEHKLGKQPTLNINHVYSEESEQTYLDMASQNGLQEFVQFLLNKGANPNRVNEMHNRAPIHFATEGEHKDALTALLADPTINPNLEAGQQTALHIAVRKNNRICAGLLLDKGASANIPDSKGLTALHLAAMKNQREMTELILQKCLQSLDVDSYKDYNDQTAREVIEQKWSDLLLPLKQENRKINVHDLKYYLNANDETNFLRNLELIEIEIPYSDSFLAEELLEMATQRNFNQAVLRILEKFERVSVKKAAQVAVQESNHVILRELLNVEPKVANDLIMNACVELGIPGKRDGDNRSDRLQCLELILQENVDVRCTDSKGNTPLHYAARSGCHEAIILLLKKGSYIGHMNKFNIPPIADIPGYILSRYFDDCVQMQKKRTLEYMLEFNYRCLIPHNEEHETYQTTQEMNPFKYIAHNNSLKYLLKHPLLSSFLYLKWHHIRYFLYANFIFYIIFYLLLNIYILRITYDSLNKNETQITNLPDNLSDIAWYKNNFLWIFTLIFLLLFFFRECLQFIVCPCHYVKNLGNWLEILLIILVFALLCGAGLQVGAVAILLSAWELVILISQHPRISIGIEMFRTVSFNFICFLFPYVFLIYAFALAFFVFFKDGDGTSFPDLGHSVFKTVIMLTGEFDANDIPFGVAYPIWSHFVFMMFVFFIAIVLLNLLNGLAISDTAEILRKAELIGLISRIRLISYMEDIAIGEFKQWCCTSRSLIRYNPFSFLARKILLFPHFLRNGKISIKLHDCPDTYDNGRNYEKYIWNESNENHDNLFTKMDFNIIKEAQQIISNKYELSNEEKIINKLNKLQQKLEAMNTKKFESKKKINN